MITVKSLQILLTICVMVSHVSPQLVVSSAEELMVEDRHGQASIDRERLVREAELVNVTKKDVCDGHIVEVELWRFWTVEDGEKKEVLTETIMVPDVTGQPTLLINSEEPWIQGLVISR